MKDVTIRDWDMAPVAVIIGEVGGVMCDLNANKILFSGAFEKEKGSIVARDKNLVNDIFEKIRVM